MADVVPGELDPPTLVKVTHHSIELSWNNPPLTSLEQGAPPPEEISGPRPCYTVQEEDSSKKPPAGFVNVYRGYSKSHVFIGLKPLTLYRYRVRASNEYGPGHWSRPLDVTTLNPPGSSKTLHKAVKQGDDHVASAILQTNPNYINVPNIMGLSPLMSASASGKTSVVQVLLELGADINYANSSGRNSLMEACYHGHVECVQLLIKHGSSCLTTDHSGFSALHYAVDGGNVDMVNFLLDEGALVDGTDTSTLLGWTPLMRVATTCGDSAMARVLIERGADVNKKDSEGNTVLMMAALNGFDELVKLLLESNADPFVKTEHGKTAADFAASFRRGSVCQILREKVDEYRNNP